MVKNYLKRKALVIIQNKSCKRISKQGHVTLLATYRMVREEYLELL